MTDQEKISISREITQMLDYIIGVDGYMKQDSYMANWLKLIYAESEQQEDR